MTDGTGSRRLVVFLGPSCALDVAAAVVANADFRPPARRGDVLAAQRSGAQVIVLIDGLMIYDYAPSPREVAEVAERAMVIGAASMGALRAVELRGREVEGIGWVYDQFLSGSIDADDEVLVRMDPRTGAPTTEPLVRTRYALGRLHDDGVVSAATARSAIRRLRDVPFDERTPERIDRVCIEMGVDPGAVDRLHDDRFDVKRADTVLALARAQEVMDGKSRAGD